MICSGAAARVAHECDAVEVEHFKRFERVDKTGNVEDAFADECASQLECAECNVHTAFLFADGRNEFAETALFHCDSRIAARDCLDGEVSVAAADGVFIARILRTAERNVHTGRVTLQADDYRELAAVVFRQQHMAGNEEAGFALEAEADLVEAFVVFADEVKHRLRLGVLFGQAYQFTELRFEGDLLFFEGLFRIVCERVGTILE